MRRGLVRKAGVLLVVALGLGTGTASAESPAAEQKVGVSALLNVDGSGRLYVNSPPGPFSPDWSWESCTSDLSTCQPFATGGDIGTGSASPNTVFRVSTGGTFGLSPVWHGNLGVITPPSVSGALRANELVTPNPAVWSGGWEGDFDQTQLAACATPTGEGCLSLTEPKYVRGCRHEGTVLDPAFTGKYLRIADSRYGPGTLFTLEAAVSPFGHAIWKASGSTSVAMLGRIKRATGRRSAKCGPPPLTEASISAEGVATIGCGLGCHAMLIAKRGKVRARTIRNVPPTRPLGFERSLTLKLSPRALKHLGLGRAHMTVRIDDRQAATRTVLLSSTQNRHSHGTAGDRR
jgi:hypothetical protein